MDRTSLYHLHVSLGAKMVPFAGYEMPVSYPAGIIKEHNAAREAAALFDVSHMGQAEILCDDNAAALLEESVCGSLMELSAGAMRYTLLTNDQGGIDDDLIIARPPSGEKNRLLMVANAARKDFDYEVIAKRLGERGTLIRHDDRSLLALQGPKAAKVLARAVPECATMNFMTMAQAEIQDCPITISRTGYTGEDGYEISMGSEDAPIIAQWLLDQPEVQASGLGARDSLRLEAGLCLYGQDMDSETTPLEAALGWAVGKRRRTEGGWPGFPIYQKQQKEGVKRKRVGLLLEGKLPARTGAAIHDGQDNVVGIITSGGFGVTISAPVAMGYVDIDHAAVDTVLTIMVRERPIAAKVAATPFVPQRYYRAPK
ncbi:MAG: glycine cleavage system aminomethyltransferase GcvT [Pseudomonadota bacterium]